MADISSGNAPRAQLTVRPRGFTLLELMITVAIVAILAAAALASYGYATVKSRRAAAKGCLTEGAQFMERYYTSNFTYAGAALPACSSDVKPYYRVEFSGTPDGSSYVVQAVPLAGQARGDSLCGTLSINQVGHRTESGTGSVADCW
ncbi:type IV pilin protein [Cognatiluteimonas telluris]|jgi:type IV pilus assembly protein PilE|uniref:type IV pilin protein n=1 Tax=Cognatiluteimonas telluris TaxID=1104775 RepID=UPI00140857EB|nr:type IV pilin protein [Lysobacter telluris]